MREIFFFALAPGRFRRLQSVGATFYYRGHFFAEPDADIVDPGGATSIFSRIMEQRADAFVFVRTVFARNAGHTEKMRNVWNSGRLSDLAGMHNARVNQRLLKFLR